MSVLETILVRTENWGDGVFKPTMKKMPPKVHFSMNHSTSVMLSFTCRGQTVSPVGHRSTPYKVSLGPTEV